MAERHYDDFELLAYLDANGEVVDIEAMSQHLSACATCGQRLHDVRSFTVLLSDRTIWEAAAREPRPPRLRAIREAIARVVDGRSEEHAERTFAELVARPIETWRSYLAARPDVRTPAVVVRLIREARAEFDNRPEQALAILDVATAVANTFSDVFVLAEHRGNLAKERANALRMLGRYPEALDALDEAERFLARLPAPSFDLAFVAWARATVLFYMTRYAEALPLAREVVKTFLQFGEEESARQAKNLVANILCEQGDVIEAHRIYSRLLDFFQRDGDEEMIARLHANLAECEARLDHPEAAFRLADEAMNAYERLGRPVEKIRVRWTLGYSLMRQGHDDDALELLSAAMTEFQTVGMLLAAAGAGLDIAELHMRHERWHLAEDMTADLVTIFTKADAPVHKTQALAYLTEAVSRRGEIAPILALIEYVRTYVQEYLFTDRDCEGQVWGSAGSA